MSSTDDFGIQRCVGCGRYTTWTEANQRVFNTGMCGMCGGVLEPYTAELRNVDNDLNEHQLTLEEVLEDVEERGL